MERNTNVKAGTTPSSVVLLCDITEIDDVVFDNLKEFASEYTGDNNQAKSFCTKMNAMKDNAKVIPCNISIYSSTTARTSIGKNIIEAVSEHKVKNIK